MHSRLTRICLTTALAAWLGTIAFLGHGGLHVVGGHGHMHGGHHHHADRHAGHSHAGHSHAGHSHEHPPADPPHSPFHDDDCAICLHLLTPADLAAPVLLEASVDVAVATAVPDSLLHPRRVESQHLIRGPPADCLAETGLPDTYVG